MTDQPTPRLDIAAQWGRLNDTLIALIDYIPDDKLNWSPREELWNFRGILLHTAMTRHNWLAEFVGDGENTPEVYRDGRTKDDIKRHFRDSWQRVSRFLADPARLDASYSRDGWREDEEANGHWVAFHLLEHDVHHRADIFHYLAELGIEHPEVGTP